MSNKLTCRGLMSFDELARALNDIPDQTMGIACSMSDVGEPYVEFLSAGLARPGDEKIIERYVVAEMCKKLDSYFKEKAGRIYWRIPFESCISPHEMVLRFDVNGPDVDFVTNEKCVKDKNWVRVAAYCRLVRTTWPIPEILPERKVA